MVQFAGWEMPLVYEGTHKNRVAGGAGESTICTALSILAPGRGEKERNSKRKRDEMDTLDKRVFERFIREIRGLVSSYD